MLPSHLCHGYPYTGCGWGQGGSHECELEAATPCEPSKSTGPSRVSGGKCRPHWVQLEDLPLHETGGGQGGCSQRGRSCDMVL